MPRKGASNGGDEGTETWAQEKKITVSTSRHGGLQVILKALRNIGFHPIIPVGGLIGTEAREREIQESADALTSVWIFTISLFVLSWRMILMSYRFSAYGEMAQLLFLALATRFNLRWSAILSGTVKSLRGGSANMDVLIALGYLSLMCFRSLSAGLVQGHVYLRPKP